MVGKQGGSDPHHPAPAFRQDAEHDITSYLDKKKLAPYWANTSGNGLVSKLIREGDPELKQDFETLMNGGATHSTLLGYILERYTRIVRDNSQDFLI